MISRNSICLLLIVGLLFAGVIAEEVIGSIGKVQTVSLNVYPGEYAKTSMRIKNPTNKSVFVAILVSGEVTELISLENETMNLEAWEETDLIINVFIPEGTAAGNHHGSIRVQILSVHSTVPVTIRVLERWSGPLDVKINPLTDVIAPGKGLDVDVSIYNLGTEDADLELSLQLIDSITNEPVIEKNRNISLGNSAVLIERIDIQEDMREGKYILKCVVRYTDRRYGETVKIEYIDVRKSFSDLELSGVPIWQIYVVPLALSLVVLAFLLITFKYYSGKKESIR